MLVGGGQVGVSILVIVARRSRAKAEIQLILINAFRVGQFNEQLIAGLRHIYGEQLGLTASLQGPLVGNGETERRLRCLLKIEAIRARLMIGAQHSQDISALLR